MIDIFDEEIAQLPDEPEEAFVALERIIRERYNQAYNTLHEELSPIFLMRRYMSIVLPAARHYGIDESADWTRPSPADEGVEYYESFMSDVDYCVSGLRLRNISRLNEHSVAFDAANKVKLRHLLDQIRVTVDKLDISVAKKDRLYSRINALQSEIDRERTRYQVFASLMIEASDDIGEAARRLEPAVRLIERVGAAFGKAKRAEDAQPELPSRREPKRIPPPKSRDRSVSLLDDEVPF